MTKLNLATHTRLAALTLAGAFVLSACGSASDVGPAQKAPGPMGTTSSPSQADRPDRNSQSTPIEKPL